MDNPARYFEDFKEGEQFLTPAKTITETDVVLFAGLTGDQNPLHTDEEFCKKHTLFNTRIAHGMLGLSVAYGLVSRLGLFDGTSIAALSVKSEYKKPIFINDTIYAKITIARKKETSKKDRGVIVRETQLINQNQEVVQEIEMTAMVKRKP